MTDTDKIGQPSKWFPITDPIKLAALGKLVEELGELASIAGRTIIQGVQGADPKTKVVNRDAFRDEIADVIAMTELVSMYVLEITDEELANMVIRADRKKAMKEKWLEMLKPQPTK